MTVFPHSTQESSYNLLECLCYLGDSPVLIFFHSNNQKYRYKPYHPYFFKILCINL